MKKIALTIILGTAAFAGSNTAAIDGKALFNQSCATCHGQQAEKKALGRSEVIVNNDYNDLMGDLKEFKNGEGDPVMRQQVKPLSMEQLQAIAHYITTLKK
jgi:cytochrome c553